MSVEYYRKQLIDLRARLQKEKENLGLLLLPLRI